MTDRNLARAALLVAAVAAVALILVVEHRPTYTHKCEGTTGVYVGRDGRAVPLPYDPACGAAPDDGRYGG